jgi:hypothetical protein
MLMQWPDCAQVYIMMDSIAAARTLKEMVHRRAYDGRELQAFYVQQAHFYMLPIPTANR